MSGYDSEDREEGKARKLAMPGTTQITHLSEASPMQRGSSADYANPRLKQGSGRVGLADVEIDPPNSIEESDMIADLKSSYRFLSEPPFEHYTNPRLISFNGILKFFQKVVSSPKVLKRFRPYIRGMNIVAGEIKEFANGASILRFDEKTEAEKEAAHQQNRRTEYKIIEILK